MNSKKILLLLALSTALYADQTPLSKTFIDFMKNLSVDVKSIDSKTIEVITPIREMPMIGGSTRLDSKSDRVKTIIERGCLAYGGDVYFQMKDNFGDTVAAHSYDQAKLKALSPEKKMDFIKLASDNNHYLVPYDDLKELYTDQRLKRSFMFDTDVLRPENFVYNTTCKDVGTGATIYTANTKVDSKGRYVNDTMVVTFADAIGTENFQKPKMSQSIESVLAEYVSEKKENKYLLSFNPFTRYSEIARSYCKSAGGTLIVDGDERSVQTPLYDIGGEMGCRDIEHPFTLRKNQGAHYMLLTDLNPTMIKNAGQRSDSDYQTIMSNFAMSSSALPIGAQSENNIGNIKLVSTVYADNGSYKLINIQEVAGNKTYKNYRIEQGKATDITDAKFVYANLKLPQSIQNAKNSLVQQCSQYGAGKISIDGYTATCTRQAYGNQCSVNLIYMRNDQFAGRETVGCK